MLVAQGARASALESDNANLRVELARTRWALAEVESARTHYLGAKLPWIGNA
jgi:hypothetical protein